MEDVAPGDGDLDLAGDGVLEELAPGDKVHIGDNDGVVSGVGDLVIVADLVLVAPAPDVVVVVVVVTGTSALGPETQTR